jgi:hypothetical protein
MCPISPAGDALGVVAGEGLAASEGLALGLGLAVGDGLAVAFGLAPGFGLAVGFGISWPWCWPYPIAVSARIRQTIVISLNDKVPFVECGADTITRVHHGSISGLILRPKGATYEADIKARSYVTNRR